MSKRRLKTALGVLGVAAANLLLVIAVTGTSYAQSDDMMSGYSSMGMESGSMESESTS